MVCVSFDVLTRIVGWREDIHISISKKIIPWRFSFGKVGGNIIWNWLIQFCLDWKNRH